MSPARFFREIGYPLTNGTLLMAMLVFFLLGQLVALAGLFGIWLAIVILPAYFRFLIDVLESRMSGREVDPPSIEMFNWIAGAWTLMPLVILIGITWGTIVTYQAFGETATWILGIVLLTLYPASMAVLAITHSALASINPLNIINLIRECGPAYPIAPLTIGAMTVLLYLLARSGLPAFAISIGEIYLFFLTFSLTGAIVADTDVNQQIDIPDPIEPDADAVDALTERVRTKILDHAYGLVSRGNRAGGLAHIETYIEDAALRSDEYHWFFEEMLRWEDTDPALMLGQYYLSHLLDMGDRATALKLMSRCYLENPRFRPLPEDRPRSLELVREQGRDDLIKRLDT